MTPERARALLAHQRPNTETTCDRCGRRALCYVEPEPAFDPDRHGARVCAACAKVIATCRGHVEAAPIALWDGPSIWEGA